MNIGALGSSYTSSYSLAVQRQPEAAEAKTSGPDKDGDSDDGSKAIKASAPTVNLSGQSVCQLINTVA